MELPVAATGLRNALATDLAAARSDLAAALRAREPAARLLGAAPELAPLRVSASATSAAD